MCLCQIFYTLRGVKMANKNDNAKLYFISYFKSFIRNNNKEFSKKYTPSIRELLDDYIELFKDISSSPENKKLENSRKAQLDVMLFHLKHSMYLKSRLKKNLDYLIAKIEIAIKETNENLLSSLYFSIFQICNSLLKTLYKISIYETISGIILQCESFREIDNCTELLINELIYDGYSMRYIQEWYTERTKNSSDNPKFVDEFIESLSTLKKEKEDFTIFFTVKNDCEDMPIRYINNCIEMKPIEKEKIIPEIASHLSFNEMNRAYHACIPSIDEYKAASVIVKAFDSYSLIVNLMDSYDYKINEKISAVSADKRVINFNIQSNDNKIILPKIDSREHNDLQDFLKYRIAVYENNIITGEISSIERCLNILKNHNYENEENMLINLWNALEYILSYYSGESIISKARFIIPKLMCLYYLKDKLNVFWNTLLTSRNYEDDVKEFIEQSKSDIDPNKYDMNDLLVSIEKKGEILCNRFGTNKQVISRKYFEIGSILACETDLKKEIELLHNKIEYDVVRIYRTRNILVHSGNLTNTNILLKNARLMQYISNLTGVILHYKMKNNNHTIAEILYSIPETYVKYLNDIEKSENKFSIPLEEVFKPQYLFL